MRLISYYNINQKIYNGNVMQVKNDRRNYLQSRFLLLDNIRTSYYHIHLSILPF
jgi:hypothetical protein